MNEQITINELNGADGGVTPTEAPVVKEVAEETEFTKKKKEKENRRNTMSKQINFSYEDKDYTLEFTRKSVKEMEQMGFLADNLQQQPMTYLPQLFAGAFRAHHRYIKQDKVEEIFDLFTNKNELIGKLVEMYNEPLKSLVEDPEEGAKNLSWTATF